MNGTAQPAPQVQYATPAPVYTSGDQKAGDVQYATPGQPLGQPGQPQMQAQPQVVYMQQAPEQQNNNNGAATGLLAGLAACAICELCCLCC
ncbi:hypothetical protein BC830DRAFT_1175332 [Chytriomyces sp. MP71]|nr:hypothetical protein BC830DRAFT_1175332 [Chytriomyces sp. MP71]